MEPCNAYAAGKSKQKNLPKKSEHKPSHNKGARIYINIATVNNPNNLYVAVTKYHWKIIVDERTVHKKLRFYDNKSDKI